MTRRFDPPAHESPTAPAAPEARPAPPCRKDTAFAAIAAAYHWRPAYPQGLFVALTRHFGFDGRQRVLDLGCGIGRIAVPLARAASEVVALDCVPAMLTHGAREASRAGLGHRIRWIHAAADDLPSLDIGSVDLAVAACSMPWMDQPKVLADLDSVVGPEGGVALIDAGRPADYPRPNWQIAADAVNHRWTRAAPGLTPRSAAAVTVDYAALLEASTFSDITYLAWEEPIERTLERVIGLQYSYAPTAPAVLGGDQPAYENDLRHALLHACPDGRFTDRRRTEAWMAARPRIDGTPR